jgi:L-asparagine transporter-like permease
MTEFTRVRTVPVRRGPVSRFNDDTMEYVIAGARILAALAALAWLAAVVAFIWTSDGRWAVTAGVATIVALAAGWFGFKINANEEWKHGPTE